MLSRQGGSFSLTRQLIFNIVCVGAPILGEKPILRPKMSEVSEMSDTGHPWANGRRPACHFGPWLQALR
jgi:hypothetical protein